MAEILNFHDENLPQDLELAPLENGGKKRSYSDTELAATPRDCAAGVVTPDKRRKENLASEQDWVHIGSTTASSSSSSTKQSDLSGIAMSSLLHPLENANMLVTTPGAWGEHLTESMDGPSEPGQGIHLTDFSDDMAPWWAHSIPELPGGVSGSTAGETSSHYPGDSVGN